MAENRDKQQLKDRVSVVITVKNDAESLRDLLNLLNKQSRLPDEVVITVAGFDSENENFTLEVANAWRPRQGTKQVITVGDATRGQGRNLGVAAAQHDLIVFTDAGCYPQAEWLDNLLKPFTKSTKTKLVSGFTWVKNSSAWQEAQGLMVLVPLEEIGSHPLPATRNMAIRRSAFNQAKGFKSQLNYAEDYDLAKRLQRLGIKSEFAPGAKVIWQGRANIFSYFTMIFNLTKGDILAKTWRLGHLTMWLRYLAFIIAVWLTIHYFEEPRSIIFSIWIYLAYLMSKTLKFTFTNRLSYIWIPLLQLVTDMAVLSGIAAGLMTLMLTKFIAIFTDSSESLS